MSLECYKFLYDSIDCLKKEICSQKMIAEGGLFSHLMEEVVDDIEVKSDDDKDIEEIKYCNFMNEIVNIFIQKCVICLEKNHASAFRQRSR